MPESEVVHHIILLAKNSDTNNTSADDWEDASPDAAA